MRIPLTSELLAEALRFSLRSSCRHCFFFVEKTEACAHEWPNEDQKKWPLDTSGDSPEMSLCKEFELR